MCHPGASNTHPETCPKFQTQLKKVALLRDMVNWCIINPLEGQELAENDARMKALEAYILSQRAGKPLQAGKHQRGHVRAPAGCPCVPAQPRAAGRGTAHHMREIGLRRGPRG